MCISAIAQPVLIKDATLHVLVAGFLGATLLSTVYNRWRLQHDERALERRKVLSQMSTASDFKAWAAAVSGWVRACVGG